MGELFTNGQTYNATLYGGIQINWIIYVAVLEETKRRAILMQESLTMLITRKHDEKITGYMMNTVSFISGDWKLINDCRPEIETSF